MKHFALSLLSIGCLALNVEAEAFVTHKGMQANMTKQQQLIYMGGVGSGFYWSNAVLQSQGQPPLYCQPSKLALTLDNYMHIFEDELKRNAHQEDEPAEYILFLGLKNTFPCSRQSN